MPWQTRLGRGRAVEHRSRASVDRAVDDARRRYRNGTQSLRLARVTDPDGNLTIIDFEQELVRERPAARALILATEERTAAREAAARATARWEDKIRAAYLAGMPVHEIARAAGTTSDRIRALTERGPRTRGTSRP